MYTNKQLLSASQNKCSFSSPTLKRRRFIILEIEFGGQKDAQDFADLEPTIVQQYKFWKIDTAEILLEAFITSVPGTPMLTEFSEAST